MTTVGTTQVISFTAVKNALSDLRLNTYRLHQTEPDELVLARYRWNLALGQSFYPSIGLLEVTLRNNLHRVMTAHYSTDRWYDQNPSVLRVIEQEGIQKAKLQLLNTGKPEEPDRLIAELSFGFWTGLLGTDYEQQIWHRNANLAKAFPFIPKKHRLRAKIAGMLKEIRVLRNRISHHEPIFKMSRLPNVDINVQDLLQWLSPNMLLLLPVGESFADIHNRGPEAYLIPLKKPESTLQPTLACNEPSVPSA
jgi:hypothetical protein